MSPAGSFELIIALTGAVLGLELLARRLRLPPAAAFLAGGTVLALLPGMPGIQLDPGLVLVLFLPPLLLASAFLTPWREFRRGLPIILELAVGTVLFTTLVVGVVAHWVLPSLPWAACFALGAIVSPPDAVSAKAVLKGLPLPSRLLVLLEGESLLNDATGLVLYRFAVVAALTGTFDAGRSAMSFVEVAAGGVIIGFVFGFAAPSLLSRLPDERLSIVGTFLVAWTSYIAADRLDVSGVLSTVTCGLVMSWRQHTLATASARLQTRVVWEAAMFVLESLVFILIGLSLRGVLQRLGGGPEALVFLPAVAAIVAAVVVARFAWILPAAYLEQEILPGRRRHVPHLPFGIPLVMSWAGMRGMVSIAAALALPDNFPGRDFILASAFAVVLVTVLVQGSTLAPLIRVVCRNVSIPHDVATLSESEARAKIAEAQLGAIEKRSLRADGTHRYSDLIAQYSFRKRAAAGLAEAGRSVPPTHDGHFDAVLSAVAAGRHELIHLHRLGKIHDSITLALEHELDLEEVSARVSLTGQSGRGD
jgi:CPA1 family monovalent cation:H+ antiporter